MASKWFGAIFLLALASLILGWIFGMPKIQSMENDISTALKGAGYENIDVNMSGNVAKLSGEAVSADAKSDAIKIANDTECSACKKKRQWHVVKDDISVAKAPALPTQSPYTFSGVKNADGSVVLSGYVPSQGDKDSILSKANRIFNGNVTDRTIRIAQGAPDGRFLGVTESYMQQLATLDKGRFSQENFTGKITGMASNEAVKTRIDGIGKTLGGKYAAGFSANINVPKAPVQNVGKIRSQEVCQTLFSDLNSSGRIQFENDRANIKGADSFNLLNKLAAAAKRCSAFTVQIRGYTDSVGDEGYNLRLSQARADTVKNYLSNQDVDVSRLNSQGFGEADPVADNSTAEGRAQNRRITFTVSSAQ